MFAVSDANNNSDLNFIQTERQIWAPGDGTLNAVLGIMCSTFFLFLIYI